MIVARNIIKSIGILVFLLGAGIQSVSVFAQGQIGLYQMNKSLPQSNYVNSAFHPNSKVVLGLPIISSTYLTFESPIALNDVVTRNGDSLQFDTDALLTSLKDRNQINLDADGALLFFGLNGKKSFFSLALSTRLNGSFAFPGEALSLIINGPGDVSGIKLDGFDLRFSSYNEAAIGYNRDITDKLTIGAKFKYLQGLANVTVDGLNGTLSSDIDSIHLSFNPWSLQTAGLDYLAENPDPGYFLFQNNNTGYAFDLGATYKLTSNINLSASVLDLGSITWRDHTKSYQFDSVHYTFEGFDFLEVIKDDGVVDESILDAELDTLESSLTPEEVEDQIYTTNLSSRFYLAGTYELLDMHTFGLVFYGQVFQSNFTPAVGLTYNLTLVKILDVGVSATYRNNSFGNFSAGLSAKLGPFTIYGIGENFDTLLYPARAKVAGVRAGVVLGFGDSKRERGGL